MKFSFILLKGIGLEKTSFWVIIFGTNANVLDNLQANAAVLNQRPFCSPGPFSDIWRLLCLSQ